MSPLPQPPTVDESFLLDLPSGDDRSRLSELYRRLVARLEPNSACQRLRVEEMATAWHEVWSLRQQVAGLRFVLRRQAEERFEEAARLRVRKLCQSLIKTHGASQKSMADHAYGAETLAERWRVFYHRLGSQKPLDIQHICDALVNEGGSDRMQNMGHHAAWLMARVMMLFVNKLALPMAWAEYSKLKPLQAEPFIDRLNEEYDSIATADEALNQLMHFAHDRLNYWTHRAAELKADHDQQKSAYSSGFLAMPGASPSIRSLMALLKIQFTRITHLEKELRTLKREQEADHQRAIQQLARLEAIRNGLALTQRKRKPAAIEPSQGPQLQGDFPVINIIDHENSVQENESAPGTGERPADSFPESELVQAVHESASGQIQPAAQEHLQNATRIKPQKTPPQYSRILNPAKRIIAKLSDAELAKPFKNRRLNQTYIKANDQLRQELVGLINMEKASRNLTRTYEPSG